MNSKYSKVKKFILLAVCVSFYAANCLGVPSGYTLVFEDNFEGTRLDTSKWSYNYPWGTYHNHRANCRSSQVSVADGILTITAVSERSIWEPWGIWHDSFGWLDLDYTSGAINTSGKFNFTHGYVEGRFKMPTPASTWPAFWMLQDGWPPEIDIFEVENERNKYHYYYHYGPDWQNEQSFGSQHWGPDLSAGWHTYGLEWTEDEMAFYFDGSEIKRYNNPDAIAQANWMYLIINLGVGGWAPSPNSADYPARLYCDWVRVYQESPGHGVPVQDQWYKIIARHSRKAIDVHGGEASIDDGINIQQWSYWGGYNQQWKIEDAGDGFYRITPRHAQDKCIDIAEWEWENGGNLQQWTYLGGSNQKWKIQDVDNGYCSIISKYNSRAVDVGSASDENGANMLVWDYIGNSNQQFDFIPVGAVCNLDPYYADLNGDCYFDLQDFAIVGQYWLGPCSEIPHQASLGSECLVNPDFLKNIISNYMSCGYTDPGLCP